MANPWARRTATLRPWVKSKSVDDEDHVYHIAGDRTVYVEREVDTRLAFAALMELFLSDVEPVCAVVMSVNDVDRVLFKNMLIDAMRREPTTGSFTEHNVDERKHEECIESSCYCRRYISSYCRLYMLYLD